MTRQSLVEGGMGHYSPMELMHQLSALFEKAEDLNYAFEDIILIERESGKIEIVIFPAQDDENDDLNAQSQDPIPTSTSDTTQDVQQNVQFFDDQPEKSIMYGVAVNDDTYERGYQRGADLADFLSRPVEVFNQAWSLGSNFTPFRFSPWDKYLSTTAIANKLKTYKLLRGTLHVKILVNGSPYHYGRVFVGMRPSRYTNNTTDLDPSDNVSITNYLDGAVSYTWQPNKVMYSSRPHVFINPSKNTPVHIHWPFMCATEYIEVNNSNDYDRLGYLEVWVLNPLRTANQGTSAGDLNITFFAWMDNVELTGITSLEAQSNVARKKKKNTRRQIKSSPKNDEFSGDGIVSGPATAIAGIASRLIDIPVIGKFAKATEIGANAVSGIAKLFGFSNPAIVDKISMIHTVQLGRMAQVNGADPVVKLSLDPKNELTIDPSTVGLPSNDEMSFLDIAKREALFLSFEWSSGTTGRLMGCRVNPLLGPKYINTQNLLDNVVIGLTPVGFIAYPFDHWTGSLVFRFQIVCSQFHRGRLAVVYTPDVATTISTLSYPSHFIHVIDLSSETDASFQVNWAQPWAWARIDSKSSGNLADVLDVTLGADTGNLSNGTFINNGRLDLFVLNELAGPADSSTVEINCYVRAGDDFKVARPKNWSNGTNYPTWTTVDGTYDLTAQSQDAIIKGSGAYNALDSEDLANQDTEYILNGDHDNCANLNLIYMGEDIRSIRSMVKRYTAYMPLTAICPSGITGTPLTTFVNPNFPAGNTSADYGTSRGTTSGSILQDYYPLTYLRYYCQGYIGYRGSIRYKVVFSATEQVGLVAVSRTSFINTQGNAVLSTTAFNAADTDITKNSVLGGSAAMAFAMSGAHVMDMRSSNSISYELPYYLPIRYAEIHYSDNPGFDVFNPIDSHVVFFAQGGTVTGTTVGMLNTFAYTYVASGEDFSFFFFIGVPPLIVERGT